MTISELIAIEPYSWNSIVTAILCGSIVGLERQLRGKPVGIRTSILLIFSTYIFITSYISMTGESPDSARIIGQIVTGVGFLGAGVILSRDGMVIGVTSAATIWALASIGVSLSIGNLFAAIKLSVVVVFILVAVDVLEYFATSLTQGVHSRFTNWQEKFNKRN